MTSRRMLLALSLAFVGCSPRRDDTSGHPARPAAVLSEAEEEHIMLLAVDLSPKFRPKIVDGGGAEFVMKLVDKYFRSRAGTQDKLVIAQLTGDGERSLLWEGTPHSLRRQFPTPKEFSDFLVSRADSREAQIHKGLRHAIEYVISDPRVQAGDAKVALFVLSNMLDPGRDVHDDNETGYLNHELNQLGWRGAAVGIYFVDQGELIRWRQRLQSLGVRNFRVESEVVGSPPLPSFE